MISLALAWVMVEAIRHGATVDNAAMFVMTGMLDVAMTFAIAVAVRGWPRACASLETEET